MKKIFAFILASIMVLSLVPASAFAAVTNCPKTHTVAVCEALGISYSQVGNPVAPSCESAGYTLYECDECGEQFVGNFVESADHDYQPDPKKLHLNVKADCTTQTNGLTYVVCSVCGDNNDGDPIIVSWNHKSVHKLSPVAGSGIGCEARSRCSLCGLEGYLNEDGELDSVAAHKWEFVKVLEEPVWDNGEAIKGLAQYKCTVCGDTKDVEIMAPLCTCVGKLELVNEAVEATCGVQGSIALYKCSDCAKYYTIDEDGNFVLLTLEDDDYNGDGVINELDAIRVIEHEVDPEIDPIVDGCDVTYFCKNCGKSYTEKEHEDPRVSDTRGLGTCASPQYTVWVCLVCTETWVTTTETDASHETVSFKIPATCQEPGYVGLYCKDEGTYSWDYIVDNELDEGINYVAVEELVGDSEATAAYVTIYYPVVSWTKLNPDGATHEVGEWVDDDWVSREDYLETIACSTGTHYKVWECKYGCSTYGYKPERITAISHTWRDYGVIYNTNTSSNWSVNFQSQTHLNMDPQSVSLTKGKINVLRECVVCGNIGVKNDKTAVPGKTYIFNSVDEAYAYHGYLNLYVYDGIEKNSNVVGTEWVTNSRELEQVSEKLDNVNCTSTGYIEFKCPKNNGCAMHNNTIYAKITAGEHVRDTEKGWTPEKSATCTANGTKGYWTCKLCGVKFRYLGYNFNIGNASNGKDDLGYGEEVLTSLTINKHASSLVEVTSDVCTGVTYWACFAEDEDGVVCGAAFTDATASKAYNANVDAHSWVYAKGYQGVAATCNADGTIQIRWCSECKILEFNALYLAAEGKIVSVNLNSFTHDLALSTDVKTYEVAEDPVVRTFEISADGKTAKDITTTQCSSAVAKFNHYAPVAGFSHFVYNEETKKYDEVLFNVDDYMVLPLDKQEANDDHTEAQYDRHMCVVCDYEYLTNYIPATGGHINAAGEILTTDCDNQVITDRECVMCGKTIDVAHVQSDVLEVEAYCTIEGYSYWYCLTEGCGYRCVEGALAVDPDNHIELNYGVEANYAHDGQKFVKCALCDKTLVEPKPVDAPNVAGVEISLYTDYESYMPGSIVNVTVSLESLLGVDVWALRFPVTYDPSVYQFVGVTNVSREFASLQNNAVLVNETTMSVVDEDELQLTGKTVAAGVVNVVANAEENVYIKGSFDLVTLQFKVIANEVVSDDPDTADVNEATDTSFTVEAAEVTNYTKTTLMYGYTIVDKSRAEITKYPIEVVNEKAKTVKSMYGDGANSVAPVLYSFLDLDMDGALTLADAKEIYAIIIDPSAEYTVLADADADGAITIADLNALYQLFIGAATIEEILNPNAEEKVIGEREMKYENGQLVYDSYCDFDFNGKIDGALEMSCMTGREDYKTIWASMGYDVSNLD